MSATHPREGISPETTMKALIASIIAGAFFLAACNTMEGAGRDIQAGGKKIEKEAVENKPSNR
jgi:predicted small secreted protein